MSNSRFYLFLKFCIQFIRHKWFRDNAYKLFTVNSLSLEHLGDSNADLLICLQEANQPYSGFFSVLMNSVMPVLSYCDQNCINPVISLGKSELYSEKVGNYSSLDMFECFFQQYEGICIEEAKKSKNVIYFHPHIDDFYLLNEISFEQDNVYISYYASLVKKYLSFTKEVAEYIKTSLDRLSYDLGEKTLAVHIRGTDYRKNYKDHNKFVEIDDYMDSIRTMMKTGKYVAIFLATDEDSIKNRVQEEFGDIVMFHDVFRSSDGECVHASQSERANHHYRLGLEILTDMYSMSKCGGIIGCRSNVVLFSIIYKNSRSEKYDDLIILDKGINKHGSDSIKYMQRELQSKIV